MTHSTHHTVALLNRFGNTITAPVVHVKAVGDGRAEVHIETNFHVELEHSHPATYSTTGHAAQGRYVAHERAFTEQQTYIYRGEFTRTV